VVKGPSWSWLYGSWIYNYLCNHAVQIYHHSSWQTLSHNVVWNLLQYHSIVRWAIQAQWAEPLVTIVNILLACLTQCVVWCSIPRDHICQVWLHLAKLFQRRRFFNISQSEKRIILGGHVYRPNGTKCIILLSGERYRLSGLSL
jgi:hypothetical protein